MQVDKDESGKVKTREMMNVMVCFHLVFLGFLREILIAVPFKYVPLTSKEDQESERSYEC